MGLDHLDRGVLEKAIDYAIQEIPELIQTSRNHNYKKNIQITNPEEFTYGYVHGKIITEFLAHIIVTYGRTVNHDEFSEMHSILQKRSRELRDVIFNYG